MHRCYLERVIAGLGMRVCVCQLGARLHYGAARSFERKSSLEMLVTDICAEKGWLRVLKLISPSLRPAPLKRLLGRDPGEIPPNKISMFSRMGIERVWHISRCKTEAERVRVYLQFGKKFAELAAGRGFKGATHVYTFSTAALEILEAARAAGLQTLLEQPSAPSEVEEAIMSEERVRYPGWEPYTPCTGELAEYAARQRKEWAIAGRIIVPSKFVAMSLDSVGVPADRCLTVPYGVSGVFSQIVREKHKGPLRVLTVGGVRLQKGPQYTGQAAKQLGRGIEFRLVGSCSFSPSAKREFQETIHLIGNVPRIEISPHFQWADVFLFPSLCDGFGIVLVEALAAGLPVITTPNTGIAIRDGIDGFVVPIRDANAIAQRLDQLASDPCLLDQMSRNAKQRSANFTLDAYSDRLYSSILTASTPAPRLAKSPVR